MKGTAQMVSVLSNADELKHAFDVFNTASVKLQDYYATLEKEVVRLRCEVEEKNVVLAQNLKEKEEAQEFLKAILESLTTGVVVVDKQGGITCANGAANEFVMLPVDTRKRTLASAISSLGKVGEELSGNSRSGNREETEIRLSGNGAEEKVLKISCFPAKLSRGEKMEKILTIEDVTELRRLERKTTIQNRLAGMGEIAVNVAHEVRNPLGSIELFASLLHKELSDRPDERRLLEHITSGVRAIENIVSNILLFTRKQRVRDGRVHLSQVLMESLEYVKMTLRQKGIGLDEDFRWDDPVIIGDAELLKQVFLNLFLNAIQAMEKDGRVRVHGSEKGEQVEIRIADTGKGIAREHLDKIFDPFFTTKRKGTGLGLTIAYKILQAHGTQVEVRSEEGKGTEFILMFSGTDKEKRDRQ